MASTAEGHERNALLFHSTDVIEAFVALAFSSSEQLSDALRFAADSLHAWPKPPPAIAVKTPGNAILSRRIELRPTKDVFTASAGKDKVVESPYRG